MIFTPCLIFESRHVRFQNSAVKLIYKPYNFSLCLPPKSGTSNWQRAMNVIEMKRRGKDDFKPEDFQGQELYRLLSKLEFHKYKMVKSLNEYWFKIANRADLKPDPNQIKSSLKQTQLSSNSP